MSKRLLVLLIVVLALALVGAGGGDGRTFEADLSGDNEVPDPVVTNTEGEAVFEVNRAETQIAFTLKIERGVDILAVAGAHIHCAPAGQNGPVVAFLAGAAPPSGFDGKVKVSATLNDGSLLPGTGCGTSIADLVDAMEAGNTYVNVHSAANPGGEVRGQIEGDDDDGDDDDDD